MKMLTNSSVGELDSQQSVFLRFLNFYIVNRQASIAGYSVTFITMFLYAIVNDLLLGRAEKNVATECVLGTIALFIITPFIHDKYLVKQKRSEEREEASTYSCSIESVIARLEDKSPTVRMNMVTTLGFMAD